MASLNPCPSADRWGQVASLGFEFSAHKGLERTSAQRSVFPSVGEVGARGGREDGDDAAGNTW